MPRTPEQDDTKGGFVVRRRLPASAARVHAAFVEPAKLEQWFVVSGYHTPADRMHVEARAGGRMDAVMVSDADASEIPFGFTYDDVEPPGRVVLRFDDPREVVVVTLSDARDGSVDLTYDYTSWPGPADEDAARRGVDDMIDLIEAALRRGTI